MRAISSLKTERSINRPEKIQTSPAESSGYLTVDPVHGGLEVVARPEQGAENGGRHGRRRRLGLEAPPDVMRRAGELQEEQQRQWRNHPFRSPHCLLACS